MPERPDLHYVIDALRKRVIGHTITAVELRNPVVLRHRQGDRTAQAAFGREATRLPPGARQSRPTVPALQYQAAQSARQKQRRALLPGVSGRRSRIEPRELAQAAAPRLAAYLSQIVRTS